LRIFVEAFPHALLDDVLQVDDTQHFGFAIDDLADHQWGAAGGRDAVDDVAEVRRNHAAFVADPLGDRTRRALA